MEGVLRARERFHGVIDIKVIAFPQEGIVTDPRTPGPLRAAIDMGVDLVGGLVADTTFDSARLSRRVSRTAGQASRTPCGY